MKASRIALFSALLFILHTIAAALVTIMFGEDVSSDAGVLSLSVATTVVSICVFAYMSWSDPKSPYLQAIIVGIIVTLLGILATSLILQEMYWEPSALMLDAATLVVAVMVGTNLGIRFNRQAPANR